MIDRSISVAVPLFNEVENVEELITRLLNVLDSLPGTRHEIVVVDDGSTDGTIERLESIDPRKHDLVIVRLSRNFGHQAALSAAIDQVRGDIVVLMDGDLQDPPEAIPDMLARLDEGYDVVYAIRAERSAPMALRFAYALFYRTMAYFSSVEMPVDSGDFSVLSRPVIDAIRSTPEHHRYVRGLRAWAGYRQTGVPMHRGSREKGKSKYTFSRLVSLAVDGLFSFSNIPLRISAIFGFLTIIASSLFTIYAIAAKFLLGTSPQGFTALIVIIVFVSGVQLMFLGIIGEYVGRIYSETKGRPPYIVRDVIRRGS